MTAKATTKTARKPARTSGRAAQKQLRTLPDVRAGRLDELQPDPDNNNAGTERGVGLLEHSVQHLGAGRSILLDKHGRIIAGNKTAEAAASIGLRDVIIVPTDGTQLVAVQRIDLDLSRDANARALAIADNRTGEVGLAWDGDSLKRAQEAGVDLSPYFSDAELARQWGADALTPAADNEPAASTTQHRCPNCGHEWIGGNQQGG